MMHGMEALPSKASFLIYSGLKALENQRTSEPLCSNRHQKQPKFYFFHQNVIACIVIFPHPSYNFLHIPSID